METNNSLTMYNKNIVERIDYIPHTHTQQKLKGTYLLKPFDFNPSMDK